MLLLLVMVISIICLYGTDLVHCLLPMCCNEYYSFVPTLWYVTTRFTLPDEKELPAIYTVAYVYITYNDVMAINLGSEEIMYYSVMYHVFLEFLWKSKVNFGFQEFWVE